MADPAPASASPSAASWALLGGLRFWLAAIVLCGHLRWFVAPGDALARVGQFSGHTAVLGFLLLSGYSIAHSLTRRPQGFYRRRVLRIYPLYVTAISVSLLPFLLAGPSIAVAHKTFVQPDAGMLLGNLVLLQGLMVGPLSSNANLWTLSIEVWCYLLAPAFLRLPRWALFALIGGSACCYGLYSTIDHVRGLPDYSLLPAGLGWVVLVWAWLFGFVRFREPDNSVVAVALLVVGVLVVQVNTFDASYRYEVVPYVVSGMLLLYATQLPAPAGLQAVGQYLGQLSYPLYLFHLPALITAYALLDLRASWALVGCALLTTLATYHVVQASAWQRARHWAWLVWRGIAGRIAVSPTTTR